ncbi:type II toxin-antitoxin system RelE/ParE family toxin [archaeon]|nr:type II toxin-antitoxin system RelE/ParE family toxin [archaeon]
MLVSRTAQKQLDALGEREKSRIKEHLAELSEDPYKPRPKADITKLSGFSNPEVYRLRVGNYRAVYSIHGKEVRVSHVIKREPGYSRL